MADLSVAQHLDGPPLPPLDEPGFHEPVGIDHAAGREAGGEVLHVDHGVLGLPAMGKEPALGQTPVERHLAALEAGARAPTRPGVEALVTLARRLAGAGGRAPAEALALLGRALGRPQIFQSHFAVSTWRQKGTVAIMPRMVGVSSCSTVWRM